MPRTTIDGLGIFVEIPLINWIRPRVKAWREAGYPGVTSTTKQLLEHWRDSEELERRRFFFCQLEAVSLLLALLRWKHSTQEAVTRAWCCPAMRSSKWKFKISETNEWVRRGADETQRQ